MDVFSLKPGHMNSINIILMVILIVLVLVIIIFLTINGMGIGKLTNDASSGTNLGTIRPNKPSIIEPNVGFNAENIAQSKLILLQDTSIGAVGSNRMLNNSTGTTFLDFHGARNVLSRMNTTYPNDIDNIKMQDIISSKLNNENDGNGNGGGSGGGGGEDDTTEGGNDGDGGLPEAPEAEMLQLSLKSRQTKAQSVDGTIKISNWLNDGDVFYTLLELLTRGLLYVISEQRRLVKYNREKMAIISPKEQNKNQKLVRCIALSEVLIVRLHDNLSLFEDDKLPWGKNLGAFVVALPRFLSAYLLTYNAVYYSEASQVLRAIIQSPIEFLKSEMYSMYSLNFIMAYLLGEQYADFSDMSEIMSNDDYHSAIGMLNLKVESVKNKDGMHTDYSYLVGGSVRFDVLEGLTSDWIRAYTQMDNIFKLSNVNLPTDEWKIVRNIIQHPRIPYGIMGLSGVTNSLRQDLNKQSNYGIRVMPYISYLRYFTSKHSFAVRGVRAEQTLYRYNSKYNNLLPYWLHVRSVYTYNQTYSVKFPNFGFILPQSLTVSDDSPPPKLTVDPKNFIVNDIDELFTSSFDDFDNLKPSESNDRLKSRANIVLGKKTLDMSAVLQYKHYGLLWQTYKVENIPEYGTYTVNELLIVDSYLEVIRQIITIFNEDSNPLSFYGVIQDHSSVNVINYSKNLNKYTIESNSNARFETKFDLKNNRVTTVKLDTNNSDDLKKSPKLYMPMNPNTSTAIVFAYDEENSTIAIIDNDQVQVIASVSDAITIEMPSISFKHKNKLESRSFNNHPNVLQYNLKT